MKNHSRLSTATLGLALLAAVVSLALPPSLSATTYTWTAPSGSWFDAGNWDANGVPVTGTAHTILLTNGTSVTAATTTYASPASNLVTGNLTVGAHNTLTLNTNSQLLRVQGGNFTNAGIIQNTSGNGEFQLFNKTFTTVNTGTIQATTGVFFLNISEGTNSGDLNNTGGTLLAKNGATLRLLNSPLNTTESKIIGGILKSEAGGTLRVTDDTSVAQVLRLSGVAVTNEGTFTASQSYGGGATTGARTSNVFLNDATTFTNAANATVNLLNTGAGTATAATQLNARLDMNNTSSFNNLGLLNITNNTTRSGTNLTSNALVFSINSATATFQNQSTGTIQVINDSTIAGASALFTSVKSITNGGTVRIKGNTNNSGASFVVTGVGNSYTQSGTGVLTLLERGGILTAPSVAINSGTLGGTGTVNGATTIGSGGTVDAGGTSNGVGTLTFANTLAIAGTAKFDLNGIAVGGTDYDTISTTSLSLTNATLTLNLGVDFLNVLTTAGGSAHLSLFTGSGLVASFTSVNVTGFNASSVNATYNGDGTVSLRLTSSVPEPASWAAIAGVLTLGTVCLRRRRAA